MFPKNTGQLYVRDTGQVINGKRIFMTFGIMAVDEVGALEILNEHQYTAINLNLINPTDRKQEGRGCSPDGILRMPIWRF